MIKFSPNDKYIYTVDKSNINVLRMYDWKDNKFLCEVKTGEDNIVDMDTND